MKRLLFVSVLLSLCLCSLGKDWYNAAGNVSGRWWNDENSSNYKRLPERFHSKVTSGVWGLSSHSAGEYVRFKTNSKNITIKYVLTDPKGLQMWHMPSTGVSGVDMYLTNDKGEEHWCASNARSFSDTVLYHFDNLYYDGTAEFKLFLPLYNGVTYMSIGVDDGACFDFISEKNEEPIVVYGTSIAQGACALRPGMAWSNILNRRFRIPFVNLGFSGNGKLEDAMFEALAEIPARVYIIDCMPNMVDAPDSVAPRLERGLKVLRKHSSAPVLLVEHDGFMNENTVLSQKESVDYLNSCLLGVYKNFRKDNIYYLSKDDIGMTEDSQVDASHATDYGMMIYADAYEKILSKILR